MQKSRGRNYPHKLRIGKKPNILFSVFQQKHQNLLILAIPLESHFLKDEEVILHILGDCFFPLLSAEFQVVKFLNEFP